MVEVIVFRNRLGELGFVQRDSDIVTYMLYPKNSLITITSQERWDPSMDPKSSEREEDGRGQLTESYIQRLIVRHTESFSPDISEIHTPANPGSYYERIARDRVEFDYVSKEFLQDIRAYENLQMGLDSLFNYVEPSPDNLDAYGHKFREVLMLACTEVEHLLLKALTENGYKRSQYSTRDYVLCRDILGLHKFEAKLARYPALETFKPFRNWDESEPTKSLAWYDAYNAVKHKRSDNFHHANLRHVLGAISAIHILIESQYGAEVFQRWKSLTEDRSMFETIQRPKWPLSQINVPFLTDGRRVKVRWGSRRKYFEDHPAQSRK